MKLVISKLSVIMFVVISLIILCGLAVQVHANIAALVDAGPDLSISTEDINTTVINGTVSDPDNTGLLVCQWSDGTNSFAFTDLGNSGGGVCPLQLSALSIDPNSIPPEGLMLTLTLLAFDGSVLSTDDMLLQIIDNIPAIAEAGPDMTISVDEIIITSINGTVTDIDNTGFLVCEWSVDGGEHFGFMNVGPNGECPLDLSNAPIDINAIGPETTFVMTVFAYDGVIMSSDFMNLTIVQTNNLPTANAGANINISSEEVSLTTIIGNVTDPDGDPLLCRWKEGASFLTGWFSAGVSGECTLNLDNIAIGLGTYNIFLEVDDGQAISSDEMILTIDNSAPHTAPGGGGVYEVNTDVILIGDVSDFDGDSLTYTWREGVNVLCSGTIQAVTEGAPVLIPDCTVSQLGIGIHLISLEADDGLNIPDSNDVIVEIVDSTVPVLAPAANKYILWPPNHNMETIIIEANATDNSGLPVAVNASVSSNEPEDGLGDGDTGPDWIEPFIDQNTGTIEVQVRRERSGSGNGRTYTISISATDSSDNTSLTSVNIKVPHDKGKKK